MPPNIFSPQTINKQQTANRLVLGAHRLNFPEGHLPGPRRRAYYEERAKGGVGLIIMEGSMVLPADYPYAYALNIHEKGAAAAYAKMAETLKLYPLLLVGQLNHYGGQGDSDISRRPLLAPSPVPEVSTNTIPKIIDEEDIAALIEGFTAGAKLLAESGFDGVEINAAQFALLRQFLSPLTNMRQDAFGGPPENRALLALTVLQSARQELGPDKILGLRLCGDEYAPWGGLGPEEWGQIAAYLCSQVQIDYIAVENGSLYSVNRTFAGIREPEDYALAAAAAVAAKVSVPVIAGGSLQSPALIEAWLEDRPALADITRALIADPLYPQKLAGGLAAKIRPCVLCKRGCHTHSQTNNPLACSVNPRAGLENRPAPDAALAQTAAKKKVAVVGAGPAGLQAALRAAELGAQVTLWEKQAQIGGSWLLYSAGQPRLQALVDYFQHMHKSLHINLKLNSEFSAATVADNEAVIIATGALPPVAIAQAAPEMPVMSAAQYLYEPQPATRALVRDTLGDWQAQAVCRLLAARGAEIVLVSPDAYWAAAEVKNGEFAYWYQEMAQLPLSAYKSSEIVRATTEEIVLRDIHSGQEESLQGADIVILAAMGAENLLLYQQLLQLGVTTAAAGDCLAPRGLMSAIREGYAAAEEVCGL